MKTEIDSIQKLISQWQTISAFANEVGCGYEAARKMRDRNSINNRHWPNVVSASKKRGFKSVDFAWLVKHHAGKDSSLSG